MDSTKDTTGLGRENPINVTQSNSAESNIINKLWIYIYIFLNYMPTLCDKYYKIYILNYKILLI